MTLYTTTTVLLTNVVGARVCNLMYIIDVTQSSNRLNLGNVMTYTGTTLVSHEMYTTTVSYEPCTTLTSCICFRLLAILGQTSSVL